MPKRIAIIGLPGSGKSTFAIKLGQKLHLPVHHLDKHQFEGKKKKNKEEFLATKESLLKEERWIIEGCAMSTLDMRFKSADTILYLDFPRLTCIWRVCKRLCTSNGHISESGCLKGINWTLIKYIWNFNKDKRGEIEALRRRYPKVEFIVFRSPKDLERYLTNPLLT